jgi:hypothetical protein
VSDQGFVFCVDNQGYDVALEPRKVYVRMSDPPAEKLGMVRIVDESGEDYLFPADLFVPIQLPSAALRAFAGSS